MTHSVISVYGAGEEIDDNYGVVVYNGPFFLLNSPPPFSKIHTEFSKKHQITF